MSTLRRSDPQGAPCIVGRSSSHFTRLTRIFAAELGVQHSFQVVHDLLDRDQATYRGNPALKIPILVLGGQKYFGSLNICRRLSEMSPQMKIEWPEDLQSVDHRNAFEVIVQAMSTEVSQIMAARGGVDPSSPYCLKLNESLGGSVHWLERHLSEHDLTARGFDLRYLEVALFCLVSHLVFRDTVDLAALPRLQGFVKSFSARQSAQETVYRYDHALPPG